MTRSLSIAFIAAGLALGSAHTNISHAQTIESVLLTEIGRYQHPYVSFPDSFSAPTLSSRIDRLGRPYLYMACSDSGLMTLDIGDPAFPVVVDRKRPSAFGGLKVMNLEQVGTLLHLALGDFAGGSQSPGLAILDVSDPTSPVIVDQYVHAPFIQGSAIVQVHDGFAYLGVMEDGVLVLDVSDPANIQYVSSYQPDPTWPGIANYPPNGRGMAIVGDILYLAYDAGGLRAIDINDPASLTGIGRYVNPNIPVLTNPAYNNVVVVDDRLYCTIDYCGLEVVDISDPSNMTQVAWLNPWNCIGLSWFGSDGHTNELIAALGDSLLFVSGADSEILAYDITDPDVPVLKGGHILPNDSASTWGVDVFGDLVVGNYINNHGIPFQPYDSKYGGVVLYDRQVAFATSLPPPGSHDPLLRIAPNPSSGIFEVRFTGRTDEQNRLRVIDPMGRVVREVRIPRNGQAVQRTTLDLSTEAPGIYHVVLGPLNERTSRRIVLLVN